MQFSSISKSSLLLAFHFYSPSIGLNPSSESRMFWIRNIWSMFYWNFQVRGEAEAFAIEAKARAEAEQMTKKADAWRDYQEAAMVDMLLETLPKVSNSCHFCFFVVISKIIWCIFSHLRRCFENSKMTIPNGNTRDLLNKFIWDFCNKNTKWDLTKKCMKVDLNFTQNVLYSWEQTVNHCSLWCLKSMLDGLLSA